MKPLRGDDARAGAPVMREPVGGEHAGGGMHAPRGSGSGRGAPLIRHAAERVVGVDAAQVGHERGERVRRAALRDLVGEVLQADDRVELVDRLPRGVAQRLRRCTNHPPLATVPPQRKVPSSTAMLH